MGDQFHSGGGQNVGQGDHAIGKQVKITQQISGNSNVVAGGDITYGVPFEKYEQVRDECERLKIKDGISDAALTSFFKILQEPQVPPGDLDSKLREFACQYQEFKLRWQITSSDAPEVKALKKQAEQAFDNGRFSDVEELLDQIDERHDNAIHQLHKLQAETAARLEKEQLGKAENLVSKAMLQRLQYRYEKSAQYYQEAAAALPEGRKAERASCLGNAGYNLERIAHYADALCLYEQSLLIIREIGDQKEEGRLLNNISSSYEVQGNYEKALDYLEQSLPIFQEVGDKEGEGATLNNIAMIYKAKGDYLKALKYYEQSLLIQRDIGDKEGEGITLNNIGQIHKQEGDHAAAFKCYDLSLAISREIKNKHGESVCLNNISTLYYDQRNYDAALKHLEQSLVIKRHISDRRGEGTILKYRQYL